MPPSRIAALPYTPGTSRCANDEVTWVGKRSGVWNGSSGPQEQGLLVKQVPGVWFGGSGLESKTYFLKNYLFCFASLGALITCISLGFSL